MEESHFLESEEMRTALLFKYFATAAPKSAPKEHIKQ